MKSPSWSVKWKWISIYQSQIRSDQISHSVVSDSLRPHESQHTRPPCPSPTPEFTDTHIHWVSDAIQPSHPLWSPSPLAPNPFQHQSLFSMSQLFAWGGQSTGVSALTSFLPKKPQGWSPSEWTGWISLQSKGLSRVFSNTTVQKHQPFAIHPLGHNLRLVLHFTKLYYFPTFTTVTPILSLL